MPGLPTTVVVDMQTNRVLRGRERPAPPVVPLPPPPLTRTQLVVACALIASAGISLVLIALG